MARRCDQIACLVAGILSGAACANMAATPSARQVVSRPGASTPIASAPTPVTSATGSLAVELEPTPARPQSPRLSATDQGRIVDSAIFRVSVPEGGPCRGPVNAKATIVVFNSFEGSWCRQADVTVDQIARDYSDQVRVCFRHF